MFLLLKDFAFRGLRVTEIHQLVHQLENDDEIVADALLLDLFKVLAHHEHEFVEEGEDHGGVGVGARHADDVQILVLNVHESAFRGLDQRCDVAFFFLLHQKRQELVDDSHFDVTAVIPGDQHLSSKAQK